MINHDHNCPNCTRHLTNVVERPLRSGECVNTESIHAGGGIYIEREPAGYVVIGECAMHGLVQNIPMQIVENLTHAQRQEGMMLA